MAVLFLVLSVLGVFLYFSLSRIVYDAVDAGLLSQAKAITTMVSSDNGKTEFEFSDEIMWEYNSPKSKSFFQIRRPDGFTIEKSESLQDFDLPFPGKESSTNFRTVLLKGVPARLVSFYPPDEPEKTPAGGQGLVIQCAEDIQHQINLLRKYRLILSFSILAIMFISASGGFIISKKALAPVKDISETIDKISESNLSERINEKEIPEELRILASSFNRTFDRLETTFKRQRQFAADASHELRTPLAVILSQSEIALRKERGPEEYKNTLLSVTEAARLMSATVEKLLALTRLGIEKVKLRFETINISEIISESVRLLSPLAEQRGISIESAPAAELLLVRGDRAALLELFTNLLDNAMKYNVPQGKIYISAGKEAGFIVCGIKDTGIGIPEKDLNKVFDRFYRVDKSRSKQIGGSGLGLSICQEIVKLHGGMIEIKSMVDKGTTVSVYLKERTDETEI